MDATIKWNKEPFFVRYMDGCYYKIEYRTRFCKIYGWMLL